MSSRVILRNGVEMVQVCTLIPKTLRDAAKRERIVMSDALQNALEIVLMPEEMGVQE